MIDLIIAIWDLFSDSCKAIFGGIAGIAVVLLTFAIPVLVFGIIWKVICYFCAFTFDWWMPILCVTITVWLVVTAEGVE